VGPESTGGVGVRGRGGGHWVRGRISGVGVSGCWDEAGVRGPQGISPHPGARRW
jgi:hypothetical protein